MKTVFEYASTLWRQLRVQRTWQFLGWSLLGAAFLFWWLVVPALRNPIVRVPGSALTLTIDCVPQAVTFTTRADYLQLQNAKLLVLDGNGRQLPITASFQAVPLDSGALPGFLLSLTAAQQSEASLGASKLGNNAHLRLSAEFARVPSLDIRSVSIQPSRHPSNTVCKKLTLADEPLRRSIVTPSAHILPAVFPQEEISDFVLKGNQMIGALSVGALILTLAWLLWKWSSGVWDLFVLPGDKIKARIASRLSARAAPLLAKNEAELITGEYELTHRRLSFARVLGPAVGFLLTVSSLIAGLHPSFQSADNTFQFVSSLQLALVATFLGLLVRIVAEFALRVQTAASERALLLFKRP